MKLTAIVALAGVLSLHATAVRAQTLVVETLWGAGRYEGPRAIAIDDRTGDFYVVDGGSHAVGRFDRRGQQVGTFRGSGPAELKRPHGVAVDSRGHVWVTDAGTQRVVTFTREGALVGVWGDGGSAAVSLRGPQAIAIDRDDNVYLSEATASRVQMFDRYGRVRTTWSLSAVQPPIATALAVDGNRQAYLAAGTRIFRLAPDGRLVDLLELATPHNVDGPAVVPSRPGALALDTAGRLYVVDVQNQRVLRFGVKSQLDRVWGGRGKARGSLDTGDAAGIAVSAEGVVHVVDYANYRVQRFSSDGALIDLVGGFAGERQLKFPTGLAVDARGDVYVADTRNHRVVKFSPDGVPLARRGAFGRGDGELQHPEGVAVDTDGSIYVADRGNGRVQKFAAGGAYLSQFGRQQWISDREHRFTPRDIALAQSGDIYVLSSDRVHRFSRGGSPLGSWSFVGFGTRLAVDRQGFVYVTSTAQAVSPSPPNIYKVYKFDPLGAPIADFGTDGWENGRLNLPSGIVFDPPGNFVVGDGVGGVRVQTFDASWNFRDAQQLPSPLSELQALALDGKGHLFVLTAYHVARFAWPPPTKKP